MNEQTMDTKTIERLSEKGCTTINHITILKALELGDTSVTLIGERVGLLPTTVQNVLLKMARAENPLGKKTSRARWRLSLQGILLLEQFRNCIAWSPGDIKQNSVSTVLPFAN